MENITNNEPLRISVPAAAGSVLQPIEGRCLPVRSAGVPSTRPYETTGTVLQHFDRARRELAQAVSVDEVKDIRDKAEAMRLYLYQARESLGMQNLCAEIRLRAERRIGELLRETGISDRRRENLLRGRTIRLRMGTASLADLGITKSQSSRWQMISTLTEEDFDDRITEIKEAGKELTTKALVEYARLLRQDTIRKEKQEEGRRTLRLCPQGDRIRILHGDFRRVLVPPVVEPDSVDLIFTDPPYVSDSVHIYADLGRFAATVLKPGRLVAAYTGLFHLPEILRLMSRHLQYVWMVAVTFPGCGIQVLPRRINSGWKPIVLFSKGRYEPEPGKAWLKDKIDCTEKSKQHHDWEQPVQQVTEIIRHLTHEGGLIVDPFLGSGTTAVACKQFDRRFVGCDVDRRAVEIATARLQKTTTGKSEEGLEGGSDS